MKIFCKHKLKVSSFSYDKIDSLPIELNINCTICNKHWTIEQPDLNLYTAEYLLRDISLKVAHKWSSKITDCLMGKQSSETFSKDIANQIRLAEQNGIEIGMSEMIERIRQYHIRNKDFDELMEILKVTQQGILNRVRDIK